MNKRLISLWCLSIMFLNVSIGQQKDKNTAPLAVNAPIDKPVSLEKRMDTTTKMKLKRSDSIIAPYVKLARQTLPQAKNRFNDGLKSGEAFFLTMRIFEKDSSKFEQIFVRVKEWDKDTIIGTIADQVNVVQGYKMKQVIKFKEKDILDWTISKPDGTEEGSYVGKYLDSLYSSGMNK